jgi:hypothetical protein
MRWTVLEAEGVLKIASVELKGAAPYEMDQMDVAQWLMRQGEQ